MTRPPAGLVAAAIASGSTLALLAAQDSEAPPAALPAPFTIERAHAAAEFTLSFQLGEEGASQVEIALDELDEKKQPVRDWKLSLDFDPFEGSRFRYGVGADALARTPSESARLTPSSEPRGLKYELRVAFPAGHGLEVTLGDGSPLLVATTPRAAAIAVSFQTSGSVQGLRASEVKVTGSPELAKAFAKLPPSKESSAIAPVRPPNASGNDWAIVTLTQAAEAPAAVEVHPLEPQTAPEGAVERLALEPADGVQVPAIVVKQSPDEAGASKRRGVLVVAGGPRGKNDVMALAKVAATAKSGAVVAAVDLLGCGERQQFQSHDSLTTYELLLVGTSASEYAAREIRQLRAWLAQRPDVDPAQVDLYVDTITQQVLRHAGVVAGASLGTGSTPPPAASSELAAAARFTEDEVRIRYDSWLLNDLVDLRDRVASPDRAVPLSKRAFPIDVVNGSRKLGDLLVVGAKSGARWETRHGPASGPTTLCASDLGPKTAIERAMNAFSASDAARGASEVTWIALPDDGPEFASDPIDPSGLLQRRIDDVLARLNELGGEATPPRKIRLFGEGSSCGIVMLLAATARPDRVESVTALRSIPSFELLLHRPPEAARAPGALGVLTQGMPAELFVKDVLARFELEECVLELRQRGIAVDWREPVDALRRPLSRHDRLAMWPRVRRLDRAR